MIKWIKYFGLSFLLLVISSFWPRTLQVVVAADPMGPWSEALPIPYNLASHVSFSRNNKIFVVGGSAVTGQSHTNIISSVSGLGGTLSAWDFLSSPMPTALIFHSGAQKDNFVYVLGGKEENTPPAMSVDKVFLGIINDTDLIESWTQLNSLPKKLQIGAAVIANNGIYFAGGETEPGSAWNQNIYFAEINADGSLGTWQDAGILPEPNKGFGMIEHNGHLIVIGGEGPSGHHISKVYTAPIKADGTVGSFIETSPLPEPLNSKVIKVDSTVISIGGRGSGGNLDKVYYANLNSDGTVEAWNLSANHLPQPIGGGAVSVTNGYVYITGGHNGSDYLDTVYMSRLTSSSPSPTPEPTKNPIVLLPGLGGSWNTTAMITGGSGGDWKKTPYVKVYDNLENTFLNAGYAEGDNYFEFYYDWLQPLDNLAGQFKSYLENTVLYGKPANTKVNLVGHSMGGMVARTYAQNYGVDRINKIVTSGSPHQGAIPAWMGWSGAEVGDRWSWQWIGLELYLQLHKGRYTSPVVAIRDLAPGLNDLTPVFDFAKNKQDQVIPVTTMDSFNSYLNNLKVSLSAELKNLLNTIAGEEQNPNQDTVEWIKLKDRTLADKLLGRWPDGRPESELYTDEGDLIVLEKSALIDGTSLATVSASHVELVENQAGIQAILNALELNTATVSTAITSPARNPSLIFFLHSPANIQVTAPDGSQAGEGVGSPMSNSIYSPEDKLLVIYDAVTGNYLANIIGAANGEYSLNIGQLTENGEGWSTVENNIGQGQTNSYNIYFDTNKPQDNPLANPEAKIYLELAKYRLEELKEYVNQQSIKTSYKKYLTSHLNQVIKLVDKAISADLVNNDNLVRRHTHSALSNNYLLRLIMDMLARRSSINEQTVSSFKTEVNEIGKLLIQAFIQASDQAGVSVSQKLAQKELKEADKKYSQVVSLVAAKVKGENYSVGSSLELNESFLNTAKTGFESGDFNQAYINALVSRIISQELKSMIK